MIDNSNYPTQIVDKAWLQVECRVVQNGIMKCFNCNSTQTFKNGYHRGRQCYKCKQCTRQFLESDRPWRYSDEIRELCIKMYLNGMGLRGIERVTQISHTCGRLSNAGNVSSMLAMKVKVYPMFIELSEQIVSKTYMTRT